MDRAGGLHGEAPQRVREQRQGQPADALARKRERDLGVRPPDEVDRCGRARLVHRHSRRPIARDALPIAERLRKRVPERCEDVLHRVMLVDVEVAPRQELEVHAGVERPECQQVVEEPDAGLTAGTARSVEVEREAQRRLGARPGEVRRSARGGSGRGPERGEQDVVLPRPPERDPDPPADLAHDQPSLLQSRAERLVGAEEDEVAVTLRAVVPGRDERSTHPFPLGEGVGDVDARRSQGCGADPGGRSADARRRPAPLELRRRLPRGDRPADAKSREPEGLRKRAQDDQVRLLVDQRHAGRAGVLVVGLVDHHRRRRLGAGERGDLGRIAQLSGRVVRVADPDQVGAVGRARHRCTGELRRDPVQAVGGLLDDRRAAGAEEGARADQDQLVGPRAGDHLLSRHAAVARGGLAELRIRPVRIFLQPCEALRERHLGHARNGRCVLVVAQDLFRPQAVPRGHLRRRPRPRIGAKALREGLRPHASSSAAACSGSPSRRASGSPIARARESSAPRTICTGFRKVSSPRPPEPRARPPVGRMCVAPAA